MEELKCVLFIDFTYRYTFSALKSISWKIINQMHTTRKTHI